MAQSIFSLFGEVFVNTEKADESLSKTEDKASGVANKLSQGIGTAAKWGTAIVGGATAVATAMVGVASKVAGQADEIDKMSQKLGLSREAYQEWDYVLSQAGVEINSLETGMKTLTNKLDDAKNGSEKAQEMFSALGLSLEDISSMSREDIFEATIKSFQSMEDSTERAALANDLFGKSGQNLIPLFNSTAESTQGLIDKAHELGMVMSDEAVDSGVEFTDVMDTLKRTFSGVVAQLGSSLLPIINEVAQTVIDFMPTIRSLVEKIVPVLVDLLGELLPPLIDMAQQILPVILEIIEPLIPLLSEILKTILPPLTTIIGALAKVIGVVLTEAIKSVMPIFDALKTVLNGIIDFVAGVFTGNWERAWNGVKSIFQGVFDGLVAWVKAPLNQLIGLINKAFSHIGTISIPDWVPVVGGKTFSLPQIPYLAKGGTINGSGMAVVGEAGAEMIEMPTGARVTPLGNGDNFTNKIDSIIDMLSQYLPMVGQGQLVLDTGVLAGAMTPQINNELGRINSRRV